MSSISLCMIVKNEEDVLGRCLESIKDIVDEIVIVDTGSTDATKKIAKSFGAKVFDFEWVDDFAAARNFAFSLATKVYTMWLDADDIVLIDDQFKLRKLKETLDGAVKQVAALYNVAHDEYGNATLSFYRERIFRSDLDFKWIGEVHECIPLVADIVYSDFAISHFKIKENEKGRNLKIYEKMREKKNLNPREQYYYARELYYNDFFTEAIKQFTEFLASDGWVQNKIDGSLLLSKCFLAIADTENSIKALYNSFVFALPKAEICCEIARLLMENSNFKSAIYWYTQALSRAPILEEGSFVDNDAHTFVPALQLCVCYDRIGDHIIANQYNELAATYKPNNNAVKQNREYFGQILSNNTDPS